MSIWLWIYVVGAIVAFLVSVCIFRDKDKRISFGDTFVALLISSMSWISVFALWVGQNIKNAVEEKDWLDDDIDLLDNDEDDFYNNNYDGF